MWRKIGILLVLTSVLLFACSSGQPKIMLERGRIDVGEVVNGEIATRQTSVSNEGKANLVIEAVTTSCGCTKATLDPMTIPPGGSGVLILEFDSGAHGEELSGRDFVGLSNHRHAANRFTRNETQDDSY